MFRNRLQGCIYLGGRVVPVSVACGRSAASLSLDGGCVSQDGGVSADRAAWNMSSAGPSTGPIRSAPEGTDYIFV